MFLNVQKTYVHRRCFLLIYLWKEKAVRHGDAILTYAPTYWPKDGFCVGCNECSITLGSNQYELFLHSIQHSRQPTSTIHDAFVPSQQMLQSICPELVPGS